jgi:hypothetical protein
MRINVLFGRSALAVVLAGGLSLAACAVTTNRAAPAPT